MERGEKGTGVQTHMGAAGLGLASLLSPGQEAAVQHDALPGVEQLSFLALPGRGSQHGELELPGGGRACPGSAGGGQGPRRRIGHGHGSGFPLCPHLPNQLSSLLCRFPSLTAEPSQLYLCKVSGGFAGAVRDLPRLERVCLLWLLYPNVSGNEGKPRRSGFPRGFQSSSSFGHV